MADTLEPLEQNPAGSGLRNEDVKIRLLDIRASKLFASELRRAPAYVAVSHVWADKLFPVAQKNDIGNTAGYHMVIAALRENCSETHHIWVDTWCIDQDDNIDKHRQMCLMGNIYREAEFVLVTLHHRLNHTQSDLDDITSKLSKAAEMLANAEIWISESMEYLESAELIEPLVRGFAFLRSVMQSSWPTRLWCFQEAALAKKLFWIGLDRVPLHISDKTLCAILDLPLINTHVELNIEPDFHFTRDLMMPLMALRMGWFDPTCAMEAAHQRNSTLEEDQIYGLMGASGVTIEPDPTKSLEMLWRKWWEEAITLGHIRWLMLAWDSGYPNLNGDREDGRFGCVVPPFRERFRASKLSILHTCRAYGAVSVRKDCVKVPGYRVGLCSSLVHLGCAAKVSDVQSCFMTVACLGRGNLELTMRIVAAMWCENTSKSKIQSISEILCFEYHSSSAEIENGLNMQQHYQARGNEECKLIKELSYGCLRSLYNANDMELYLTTIECALKKTDVIIQASKPIAPGNLLALDLNADMNNLLKSEMQDLESRILMIAQSAPEAMTDGKSAPNKPNPHLHKAGITLPVRFARTPHRATALQVHTWDGSPPEDFTFPLSAASCSVCRLQDITAPEIRRWLKDLHEKGVEQVSWKDIQVEYQRRFGRGQVEFLPDVKDRGFIDEVFHRDSDGGYSNYRHRVGI